MPTTSTRLVVLVTSLDVGLHCVTDTVTVDSSTLDWPASATSTSGRPVDGPRFSII